MCFFSSPSIPAPAPAPVVPAPIKQLDIVAKQAQNAQAKKAQAMAGLASGATNAAQGVMGPATTQTKTLLGQ